MEKNIRAVLDNAARSIKATLPGCTVILFGSRARIRMPLDLLLYTHDEFEESAKKPSRKQYHIKKEGVVLGCCSLYGR